MDEMEKRVQALEFRVPEQERYFKLTLREHRAALDGQVALLNQRMDAIVSSIAVVATRIDKLADKIEILAEQGSARQVKIGAVWAAALAAVGAAGAYIINKVLGG